MSDESLAWPCRVCSVPGQWLKFNNSSSHQTYSWGDSNEIPSFTKPEQYLQRVFLHPTLGIELSGSSSCTKTLRFWEQSLSPLSECVDWGDWTAKDLPSSSWIKSGEPGYQNFPLAESNSPSPESFALTSSVFALNRHRADKGSSGLGKLHHSVFIILHFPSMKGNKMWFCSLPEGHYAMHICRYLKLIARGENEALAAK